MSKSSFLDGSALLVVDVQNDFCTGGGLAVEGGEEVVPVINSILHEFPFAAATKDWHPSDHVSFASNHEGKAPFDIIDISGIRQTLWPDHCIRGTAGAELHRDLDLTGLHFILHKGFRTSLDSYSAFFENDGKTRTGLSSLLKGLGIHSVYVTGLAEDVCVFYTAMDARKLGFETFLISDACRGVNVPDGNLEDARNRMKEQGVIFITSGELAGS